MAIKSYGFAIGNLRARENSLLKYNDYLSLLSATDVNELASRLSEKGIGDRLLGGTIPEMLSFELSKLWSYIIDIAPDMSAFEPFLYENDFHNLKAVIKATVKQEDFSDLTVEPSGVEVALIKTAVEDKKYSLLPPMMSKACERAYEVITKTGDSQLADCIIDAACIEARLEAARVSRNETVEKLILTDAFYKNIKVALRAARAHKSKAFLEEALCEGAGVDKKTLITAVLSGEEKVLELLSSKSQFGGDEAAEAYSKSASAFEKYADNRYLLAAKDCKAVTLGIEPLIWYTVAVLNQIKNLRIVYSGIKTGSSEESIKERLREIYG